MTNTSLLSCLLLAFITNPFFCTADDSFDRVYDTGNKPLQTGHKYYVLPATSGNGGGLILSPGKNQTCPFLIVQNSNKANNGMSVTFSPVTNDSVVLTLTDFNIQFSVQKACKKSTVWRIDANSQAPGQVIFVILGGVKGNPGAETITDWFRIEELDTAYNFLYCPTICDVCRPICRPVGIVLDDGKTRLALSDVPFPIVFKKA